ncbi:hypothetical protein CYMTET_56392, partial [Cymbomonas tetramitiformis]
MGCLVRFHGRLHESKCRQISPRTESVGSQGPTACDRLQAPDAYDAHERASIHERANNIHERASIHERANSIHERANNIHERANIHTYSNRELGCNRLRTSPSGCGNARRGSLSRKLNSVLEIVGCDRHLSESRHDKSSFEQLYADVEEVIESLNEELGDFEGIPLGNVLISVLLSA